MKKFLFLLLLAFSGSTVSSQVNNVAESESSHAADSLKKEDREVNRKFLNNGNTLLNMRGAIPEFHVIVRPQGSEKLKKEVSSQEKLIANTLLFTGNLKDYISQPFMICRDTSKLKVEY